MASPNVSELAATTLERRSKKIKDQVIKNNAALSYMRKGGNVSSFAGGTKLYEEISYQANSNAGWYSGFDPLPVAAQDVISAAEWNIAQCAVPVVMSGLEELQNSGAEGVIDLLEARIKNAETSMANLVAEGVYSDGTGSGGKQITGLDAAVPILATISQSNTYGGISRTTWAFWRSYSIAAASYGATTIQAPMSTAFAAVSKGSEKPNVILADNVMWGYYLGSLQANQRFTDPSSANLGFSTVKFMDADFVLDGGVGGFATTKTMYFLNTNWLKFRIHKDRDFTTIGPKSRYAVNQDASVTILGMAGQMTCSNCALQGRLIAS
jgi:hypothetical protein